MNRIISLTACFCLGLWLALASPHALAQEDGTTSREHFQDLLKQLSDPSFAKRDLAERDLSAISMTLLPELVSALFSDDIELSTRCLRILKSAHPANEVDVLRLALVLNLLADNGFEGMRGHAQSLVTTWKIKNVQANIEILRTSGAVVHQLRQVDHEHMVVLTELLSTLSHDEIKATNSLDAGRKSHATVESQQPLRRSLSAEKHLPLVVETQRLAEAHEPQILAEYDKMISTASDVGRADSAAGLSFAARSLGDPSMIRLYRSSENGMTKLLAPISIELNQQWLESSRDFATIRALPYVESLALVDVEIDRGLLDEIRTIQGLRSLAVNTSKFDHEILKAFVESNPQLSYTIAPKSYLGVYRDMTLSDYTILQLLPGSPAEAAGVLPRDKICRLGDTNITRSEDLQLLLAKLESGTTLPLIIQRQDQMIELSITTGSLEEREKLSGR
ncbi:MAG TPA: PDZ domain-containing protein [Pirellulaceae bacterium]|nr:PDZ domain-containing protein [Pirellulaceae bacterium]HMO92980.1 PDZ domain-containing protein [Pirellulaceae bacterium]HMP67941.1 PDZ domain-containing protein [Pirellulaceae bacterium]